MDIFAEWTQIKSSICVSPVKIFPKLPIRPKSEVKNGSERHAQNGFLKERKNEMWT